MTQTAPAARAGRPTRRPWPARFGIRLVELLGLPVLLILIWWWASATSDNYYMPTPDVIAATFGETWFSDRIVRDVLPSLGRLLAGYGLAAVLGVLLGVLLGLNRTARALTEPVLEFLRAIPPPVLVPLMILLAGIDNGMKILVIISGCIWPILLNTVEGVRAIDPVLSDTCRSYGIRGTARLRVLILRSASPQIMAGLRLALAIAIILMVISEMFASSSGLGFTIVQFQRSFAIPEMWSGIVLLGLIGFTASALFMIVERRTLRWYTGLRAATRGG